ncbi:MAG TPA: hypothetical protein VL117_11345 [Thermoleophilia bacterium]|nr:hypothetical protein [Thermoleophilia bacterium]
MRLSRNALVVLVIVAFSAAAFALIMATRPSDSRAGDRFVGSWRIYESGSNAWVVLRISRAGAGFSVYVPSVGVATSYKFDDDKLVPTAGGQAVFSIVGGRVVMTSLHSSPGAPGSSVTLEPLAAQSTAPDKSADDASITEGVHVIQVAVQSWAVDHGDAYPKAGLVVPGGAFAAYVDNWPGNPVTGRPMTPGRGPGDYTYEQLKGGYSFRVTGYGVDGSPIVTVP